MWTGYKLTALMPMSQPAVFPLTHVDPGRFGLASLPLALPELARAFNALAN